MLSVLPMFPVSLAASLSALRQSELPFHVLVCRFVKVG